MTKVKVFKKKAKLQCQRSEGAKSWYQMKGLAGRNTHVKYESPTTYQSKFMTKVKVFEKNFEGQTLTSKVRGLRSWYQMKGLARRNTNVKYDRSTAYKSKVITKVKVLEKKAKVLSQRSEGQSHSIK
jgi:hypothetical protein